MRHAPTYLRGSQQRPRLGTGGSHRLGAQKGGLAPVQGDSHAGHPTHDLHGVHTGMELDRERAPSTPHSTQSCEASRAGGWRGGLSL